MEALVSYYDEEGEANPAPAPNSLAYQDAKLDEIQKLLDPIFAGFDSRLVAAVLITRTAVLCATMRHGGILTDEGATQFFVEGVKIALAPRTGPVAPVTYIHDEHRGTKQ